MYIKTIIGPFEKNNQITLDKQNIIHIGIEQLNSLPIISSKDISVLLSSSPR